MSDLVKTGNAHAVKAGLDAAEKDNVGKRLEVQADITPEAVEGEVGASAGGWQFTAYVRQGFKNAKDRLVGGRVRWTLGKK